MYLITIQKIETVKEKDQEYQKVADSGNPKDDGPVYDYVTVESEKNRNVEVYSQRVDDINLVAVIDAVNKEVPSGN